MKKLYVIKNIKTNKYYTGNKTNCRGKDINNAYIFDKNELIFYSKELSKNERFVEIEIKEKSCKKK